LSSHIQYRSVISQVNSQQKACLSPELSLDAMLRPYTLCWQIRHHLPQLIIAGHRASQYKPCHFSSADSSSVSPIITLLRHRRPPLATGPPSAAVIRHAFFFSSFSH